MKPCLVIGSGFHSWVYGKSDAALTNWDKLIDEVSESMLVAIPSKTINPVLRWEKLLENAGKDGYRIPGEGQKWVTQRTVLLHQIEVHAKKAVATILNSYRANYPSNSSRAKFPLSQYIGSVISLNFDCCWLGDSSVHLYQKNIGKESYGKLDLTEIRRLHHYITYGNDSKSKIWQPNGSIKNPQTIRMGLYDYGAMPFSIKEAFKRIKEFERQAHEELKFDSWRAYKEKLENAISESHPNLNTWVADFLYRPIYFAGVGLSESEIGLWWLLAQRARNFSRLNPKDRPETAILLNASDARMDFWKNRPCGVVPIRCENWDEGWEMIMDRINPPSINGGSF